MPSRSQHLVHIEVLAQLPGGSKQTYLATMRVEGEPHGTSAMSRAVGAAIAARLVLEGTIDAVGPQMPPTLPGFHEPMFEELSRFGFAFEVSKQRAGSGAVDG